MASKYVSTFRAPTEYELALERARKQKALAEALAQQEYTPMEGVAAPIPRAAPLVKALQGYLTARAGRKAAEAEAEAKGMETRAGEQIAGRVFGGAPVRDVDTTPDESGLAEVAIQSQYRQSPQDALRMASTPQGAAALRGNPALAAVLQKSMEEKTPKSPYGSVDPGKFTTASLQKFDASVRAGNPDYTLLQSREYSELTPQQQAQIALDVGKYGIESGRFSYETGQQAPQLPRFPFQSQPATPNAPPAAAPTARPTAAPVAASAVARPSAAIPASGTSPVARRDVLASEIEKTEKKQPSAFELATPKQRQALQQEFPQARQAAQVGLAKLDQLDDYLSDLEQHKGTENITGLIGQIPIDIAPESRSARSVLEGFQQGASIQAINEARQASETGGAYGNMTVQEWPRLEGVFGAVVAAKDPEAFDTAIKNARRQIAAARDRYESSWKATYGDMDIGYKRAEYTPESKLYPRNKPQSAIRSQADAILRGE